MNSLSIATFILLFFSFVTASNNADNQDQQLEDLELPVEPLKIADEGPRETRHNSLIQYKAPSSNNFSSEKSVSTQQSNTRPLHHYKSFDTLPLVSFRTIKISKVIYPYKSPIISQLNILDQLMASAKFPLVTEPRNIMTGHLSVLKARCRNLAATLGPLNPKATKCAFRYHELVRFIQLLIKYDTNYENVPIKRNLAFCSALVSNLKRLQTLVGVAIYEYSHSITQEQSSIASIPELEPHSSEIKDLDKTIDNFDLHLLFYCGSNPSNHESIDSARNLISKFLHIAFV
jgi:hypothetical protein